MASIGHVAIGMAAGRLYAPRADAKSLAFRMFTFAAVSLLPDADVISFALGIPYAAPFGHRGASHSIAAALTLGVLAGLVGWWQAIDKSRAPERGLRLGLFMGVVALTHGSLDAMTNGGEGVALLWPLRAHRFFYPWRPIPVAPIGIHFLSCAGLRVAGFELLAFAPFFLYALWPRRRRS